MMTTLGQQNAWLIEENAKLKLQSATEKMSQAKVDAVRDEANKRLKEARERDDRANAEIKQTAQEQCERVGIEAEALKTQVQELQNSSNLSAVVLEQTKHLQEAAQKSAGDAESRRHEAEDAKYAMSKTHVHLLQRLDTMANANKSNEEAINKLKDEVKVAADTIALLEEQRKQLRGEISGYGKMQQQWREDVATCVNYKRMYDDASDDLKFAIGKAQMIKIALARVRLDYDEAVEEQMNFALNQ
jgi:chromosome segregation ATPase